MKRFTIICIFLISQWALGLEWQLPSTFEAKAGEPFSINLMEHIDPGQSGWLVVTVEESPSFLEILYYEGKLSGTPEEADIGEHELRLSVENDRGQTAEAAATLFVLE